MNERFAILISIACAMTAAAASLPTGFTETSLTTSLASATAMAVAPDGRIFVCQQGGALRVIKNGVLLAQPFVTVTVSSSGERGLLGVAFDPNFAANNFVYVYYTATTPAIHNRVSRFTASGDVAVGGSESIILELDNLSGATNHNGGALHFGPDGKLYIAVGENANGSNAQTLANLLGKMLRINADGTIPPDNPFFNVAAGKNRAIWAIGLRNPFTFAFQNGTGRMFINDVGQNTWEEINDGLSGANYGWPSTEGETSAPGITSPLFVYGHGSGATTGCAITGGAFYNPATVRFPASYIGQYFFADYCSEWIRRYDPSTDTAAGFATGAGDVVDLTVSPGGKLYYLNRNAVFEIDFTANQAPQITTHPLSQTVPLGQPVTFSVAATGTAPFAYQWERNSSTIPGATSLTYTIPSVTATDNGAQFRCRVTNSFGTAISNAATLTVTVNQPPTATISTPVAGTLYTAGQTITFTGTGVDPEQGTLPPSAFTWSIDFHHDSHTHPALLPTSGITGGSYAIPDIGETSANVFYRIYLTVRDSPGLTHTTFRDVQPRKATITLDSVPVGAQLTLDGQPVTSPISVLGVVGIKRTLGAVSPQVIGGQAHTFVSWSDGGAQSHVITTPAVDTVYRAQFTSSSSGGGLIGYWAFDEGTGGTAVDSSGSGYHGAIAGASWTTGKVNSGLSFSGSSSVVTPGISLGNTFSVSAWVNPATTTQSAWARIAETRWDGGLYLGMDGTGTRFKFIVNSGSGITGSCGLYLGCTESGPIASGWHLVTATYDGSIARLYVDGAMVASETFAAPPNTNYPLYIGRYYGGGGYGWNGSMDDVRLYNRALTSAEVAGLYGTSGTGPIGYWAFDEGSGTTAVDSSGSGYHGVITGASWTTGKINSGLSFNGSSGVVTPGISLANTFSVSAWVNPATTTQSAWARIAETRWDGGFYLGMDATGTRFKFIVNGGSGTTGTCGRPLGCAESGTITSGWHLVTATYDGWIGRLYVDGALIASETFTALPNTNYPLFIGRYYGGGGNGWNGSMDDVRLYNRALTSAEVAGLYGVSGNGPIGYWAFDEGSGTTATDTSGSGYHGAITGASWTTGKVNSGLSFNGSSSVVTPGISLASRFSVSAWVNPATTAQTGYARIAETRWDGGFYLGMDATGTRFKFIVNSGSGITGPCGLYLGCTQSGPITSGWHLVTATYDGSIGRLYVDGALVASETFTAPPNTNYPFYIGRYYGGGGYGWIGSMDDVRLYNRALTSAEVAALSTGSLP